MPRKSLEVTVEPRVLIWARESVGLSIPEVAKRLKASEDTIRKWESGQKRPTLMYLEKLARTIYKRPFAVFLLPKPPEELPFPNDFRSLPSDKRKPFSPKTRLAIRRARRLQSLTAELARSLNRESTLKIGRATLSDDPEVVANSVREQLGVDLQTQFGWTDENKAFNEWGKAIEKVGILVFQIGMPLEETRGFSLTEGEFPAIVINIHDSTNGRIFSLFHEYGHLLLHNSGICDMENPAYLSEEVKSIEKFCNHFAGAVLVPRNALLNHELTRLKGRLSEWPDEILKELAKTFKVSQEVILRRLLILERATEGFYKRKHEEWVMKQKEAKKEQRQKFLFSMELGYRQLLKDGAMSDALREVFENNKLSLTSEAKIAKKDDKHWKIKDGNKIYKIEDTDTRLNIYEQKGGGGQNPPKKCIWENGVPFVTLVLETFGEEKITYRDVADYLAIRLKHLPKVEQLIRSKV